jgi:hypothetical protein
LSGGFAYAVTKAVSLHKALSAAANLCILLETQKSAEQLDTLDAWAAIAKELHELTAAAAEPALQLFAVACHYWHEQLTTEEELLTDSQQMQPQQQQAHSHGLRPLQATQLPRQPFKVKPQEVSAAHELLLQHLLGDAYMIYLDCAWDAFGCDGAYEMADMIVNSTSAVFNAVAGATYASLKTSARARSAAPGALCMLLGTVELVVEAMQLQHYCLQQEQQQQQRLCESPAHEQLLWQLNRLLAVGIHAKFGAKDSCDPQAGLLTEHYSKDAYAFSPAWARQVLQLSTLQIQLPFSSAERSSEDAEPADESPAESWAGGTSQIWPKTPVDYLACSTTRQGELRLSSK